MPSKFIATIDSTHGGFINGNSTWYLEDDMSSAAPTWIAPYNKPVLRHHNIHSDAIGHVIESKFIPTPNESRDNKPKGHIQLRAVISDPDAIQKIKDGRFNPVSISTDAKFAKCSVCDHVVSKDGLCEHTRGKTYEGKKAFWSNPQRGTGGENQLARHGLQGWLEAHVHCRAFRHALLRHRHAGQLCKQPVSRPVQRQGAGAKEIQCGAEWDVGCLGRGLLTTVRARNIRRIGSYRWATLASAESPARRNNRRPARGERTDDRSA